MVSPTSPTSKSGTLETFLHNTLNAIVPAISIELYLILSQRQPRSTAGGSWSVHPVTERFEMASIRASRPKDLQKPAGKLAGLQSTPLLSHADVPGCPSGHIALTLYKV